MIAALTVLLWLLVVIVAGSVLLTVWLGWRLWRLSMRDKRAAATAVGAGNVKEGAR